MNNRLKLYSLQYIKNYWLVLAIIGIFFLTGLIFGSIGVQVIDQEQAKDLVNGLNDFLNKVDKTSINYWTLALTTIGKNLLILLAIYVLGLTIIGVPITLIIIFTRGFRLGFTIGFLIKTKAAKGILLALASIIPHNLIYLPAYIIAAQVSVVFSLSLIRGRSNYHTLSLSGQFIKYTLFMLFLALLITTGGFVESYVTPTLVKTVAIYIK